MHCRPRPICVPLDTDIGRLQKLEYCLFQPGFFTNYFGFPYASTKHFNMSATYIDFQQRRAIMLGDGNYEISLTTVQDMAEVVAEALDHPGEWPTEGQFCGSRITMAELIRLGEGLRGRPSFGMLGG